MEALVVYDPSMWRAYGLYPRMQPGKCTACWVESRFGEARHYFDAQVGTRASGIVLTAASLRGFVAQSSIPRSEIDVMISVFQKQLRCRLTTGGTDNLLSFLIMMASNYTLRRLCCKPQRLVSDLV